MIYLTIEGQEMAGILTAPLVSGQVNFVEIKTMFDSTWDDLNKSYQFRNGNHVNEVDSNDDIIGLPYEATATPGTLEINVVGTKLDDDGVSVLKKATTNTLRFKVGCCNLADDPDNCGDVSPTVVEQIRQIAESAEDKATEAERISAVIWEAYKSGELNGKDGKDGTVGKDGVDGISPTVVTEQTSTGATITITDVNGTQTVELKNGKDGKDGDGGGGIYTETDPIYSADKPKLALKSELPTQTSQLTNDSKFATTDYVDEEIATFDFIKVVDLLPTTGLPNRIYFVPKKDVETQDLFDEYAWINDEWEWITTKQLEVDLVDYVRNTDYAKSDNGNGTSGVVKVWGAMYGIDIRSDGHLKIEPASQYDINKRQSLPKPIVPSNLDHAIYSGLVNNSKTLTSEEQTTIKSWLGINESSGDGAPVGNIISFMGTIAPSGYLICDGAEYNIADYPKLASHFETQFGTKNQFGGDGSTTFAVPDLRNEFLRGYHCGGETQLSGEIGVHQDGTQHLTIVTTSNGAYFYRSGDTYQGSSRGDAAIRETTNQLCINGTNSATNAVNNKYTSRPTNVAVLYCIKY